MFNCCLSFGSRRKADTDGPPWLCAPTLRRRERPLRRSIALITFEHRISRSNHLSLSVRVRTTLEWAVNALSDRGTSNDRRREGWCRLIACCKSIAVTVGGDTTVVV